MTKPQVEPVIFWFRRDLRLNDNLGLIQALQSNHPVIPVFIFDPALIQATTAGSSRLKFMLNALESLDQSLREWGSALVIQHGEPELALAELYEQTNAVSIYFNADYSPYARKRDQRIQVRFSDSVFVVDDRLLVKPGDLLKSDSSPYTTYTPFKSKWHTYDKLPVQKTPLELLNNSNRNFDWQAYCVPGLSDFGYEDTGVKIPDASEFAAATLLNRFQEGAIFSYADCRDIPGNLCENPKTHTSSLSPYIRFGLISLRTIFASTQDLLTNVRDTSQNESVSTFADEIIWHEFFTHILWHFPHTRHRNLNHRFDGLPWRDAPEELEAWKLGQTGYPIVDAAMRQLREIGWMHNRLRMIAASFLTKHLLIDWKQGEQHFMQYLIDGDPAANSGGWQWVAGTGASAQPYFRIFSPVTQSQRYDPEGNFIRSWIPELNNLSGNEIHVPWELSTPPTSYPPRIVDHGFARERALDVFQFHLKR